MTWHTHTHTHTHTHRHRHRHIHTNTHTHTHTHTHTRDALHGTSGCMVIWHLRQNQGLTRNFTPDHLRNYTRITEWSRWHEWLQSKIQGILRNFGKSWGTTLMARVASEWSNTCGKICSHKFCVCWRESKKVHVCVRWSMCVCMCRITLWQQRFYFSFSFLFIPLFLPSSLFLPFSLHACISTFLSFDP